MTKIKFSNLVMLVLIASYALLGCKQEATYQVPINKSSTPAISKPEKQKSIEGKWWEIYQKILHSSSQRNDLVERSARDELDTFYKDLRPISEVDGWVCEVQNIRAYGDLCRSTDSQLALIECKSSVGESSKYNLFTEINMCVRKSKIDLTKLGAGSKIVFSGKFNSSDKGCPYYCSYSDGFADRHTGGGIQLHIKNAEILDSQNNN